LKIKGTTLVGEVAHLREELAARELVETNRRIADIPLSVGFKDLTVSSRAFKNRTDNHHRNIEEITRLRKRRWK